MKRNILVFVLFSFLSVTAVFASADVSQLTKANAAYGAEKFEDAVNLIREEYPLPSICGRICTHECEYNCTLIGTNHPIAVREIKKFVTDWEMKNKIPFPPASHPTGSQTR